MTGSRRPIPQVPQGVLYAFVTSHERDCDGDFYVGGGCSGCEVTVHEVRLRYPAPQGRDSPAALDGARRAVLREVRRRLAASDPASTHPTEGPTDDR